MSDAPVEQTIKVAPVDGDAPLKPEANGEDNQPKLSPKEHELLLENMKKKDKIGDLKNDLESATKKLQDYEMKIKEADELRAKEAGDFKTLWENAKSETDQFRKANEDLKETIKQESVRVEKIAKYSAVGEHLKFANADYKAHFPIENVKITEDGRIDADSLKTECDKFKQTHPNLLVSANNPLHPTTRAPQSNSQGVPLGTKTQKAEALANFFANKLKQ